MTKETQYAQILAFLRRHKQATVRQLLRFTNYPSARLYEMVDEDGFIWADKGGTVKQYGAGIFRVDRLVRLWTTTRDGRKIRLYRLENK